MSPHSAGCPVWLCFLQQGLGITTQHESDFTYGRVTWDLDPTERSEEEVNERYHHLIRKSSLLELHDISLFSILEYVYQNVIDIFLTCWS